MRGHNNARTVKPSTVVIFEDTICRVVSLIKRLTTIKWNSNRMHFGFKYPKKRFIFLHTRQCRPIVLFYREDEKTVKWRETHVVTFRQALFTSFSTISSTPLLHILYYINGLIHDFWTRTGGWEFDRSHVAGTSSPSHWQQVKEQAPKPVGWTMCFVLMTLVPVQKLCVDIYVYIYVYVHSLYEFCYRSYIQRECHSVLAKLHPITFYRGVRCSWAECHFFVFFGLPIVSLSLIKI